MKWNERKNIGIQIRGRKEQRDEMSCFHCYVDTTPMRPCMFSLLLSAAGGAAAAAAAALAVMGVMDDPSTNPLKYMTTEDVQQANESIVDEENGQVNDLVGAVGVVIVVIADLTICYHPRYSLRKTEKGE